MVEYLYFVVVVSNAIFVGFRSLLIHPDVKNNYTHRQFWVSRDHRGGIDWWQ